MSDFYYLPDFGNTLTKNIVLNDFNITDAFTKGTLTSPSDMSLFTLPNNILTFNCDVSPSLFNTNAIESVSKLSEPAVKLHSAKQAVTQEIPYAEEIPDNSKNSPQKGFFSRVWSGICDFFDGAMDFMAAPFSTVKNWIFGKPNPQEKQSKLSQFTEMAGNVGLGYAGSLAIGPYMMIGNGYQVVKELVAN